jgi:hypothetical protein
MADELQPTPPLFADDADREIMRQAVERLRDDIAAMRRSQTPAAGPDPTWWQRYGTACIGTLTAIMTLLVTFELERLFGGEPALGGEARSHGFVDRRQQGRGLPEHARREPR